MPNTEADRDVMVSAGQKALRQLFGERQIDYLRPPAADGVSEPVRLR